jgi:hypothetical protein
MVFLALGMLSSMVLVLVAIVFYISNWFPSARVSSIKGDFAPFFSSFLGVPVAIRYYSIKIYSLT